MHDISRNYQDGLRWNMIIIVTYVIRTCLHFISVAYLLSLTSTSGTGGLSLTIPSWKHTRRHPRINEHIWEDAPWHFYLGPTSSLIVEKLPKLRPRLHRGRFLQVVLPFKHVPRSTSLAHFCHALTSGNFVKHIGTMFWDYCIFRLKTSFSYRCSCKFIGIFTIVDYLYRSCAEC